MPSTQNNVVDFDTLWNYSKPAETEERFREILGSDQSGVTLEYNACLLTQIARCQGLQMKFEAAILTLNEAEKLITDDMPLAKVRLLLERGRILNSSGKPAESAPLFLRAWEIAREAALDFHAVDAAHMLGIVLELNAALEWNERACEAVEQSENQRAKNWLGALYNNIGWTYHSKGDYQTALSYFQKDEQWYSARNLTP